MRSPYLPIFLSYLSVLILYVFTINFISTLVFGIDPFEYFRILLIFGAAYYLLGYLISPLAIKLAYSLKEPASLEDTLKEKAIRLEKKVREYCDAFKISRLKFYIADVDFPNAFAFSHILFGNYVVVTKNALEILENDELEAVVLHELGHIKHKDSYIMLILLLAPFIMEIIIRISIYRLFLWPSKNEKSKSFFIDFIMGTITLPFYIALLAIIYFLNRRREVKADLFSKNVIGGIPLAKALIKITNYIEKNNLSLSENSIRSFYFALNSKKNAMIIGNLNDEELVNALKLLKNVDERSGIFDTHPTIFERLKYLLD